MKAKQFVAALKKLGYTPHNADELLGCSRAAAFKWAKGETAVPLYIEKLISMYLRHGVPKEDK
jgi:hypothetical protein